MAEWVPPTPPPPPSSAADGDPNLSLRPATYVVQVPKDQIYRVPPPGNAHLVEQYRNNLLIRRQRRSPCVSGLIWLLATVLLVAILLLVLALVFFLVVRPGVPSFAVQQFLLSDSHRPKPEYDITLRSRNPSARMGFSFESGGKSVLSHQKVDVATGETPGFYLGNENATVIKLVLHGSKETEGSLKGSKAIIPLALSVQFPVRLTVGGMTVWAMNMEVECDVRASGLAKRARVMSQECSSKLRS